MSTQAGVPPTIDTEELTRRVELAAGYLHGQITDSGKFFYRRYWKGDYRGPYRYNILRHAGALYALADYHTDFPAGEAELANLGRAAGFLVDCCARPLPDDTDIVTLWSESELSGANHPPKAKLGAAGLGLAAMIAAGRLTGTSQPREFLVSLGRFLEFMQEPSGRFISRYIPSNGGKDDSWVSLYYPGEAALGLYYLYESTADSNWIRIAVDALRFLARSREGLERLPADHWTLIATAHILSLDRAVLIQVEPAGIPFEAEDGKPSIRGVLLTHAEQVVDSILREQFIDDDDRCLAGGFNPEGRIAPAATRLEGLIAALDFLPAGDRRDRVIEAVDRGIDFLIGSQLLEPPFTGAFARINPRCNSEARRAAEVRIDTAQHALSAMLMYLRKK